MRIYHKSINLKRTEIGILLLPDEDGFVIRKGVMFSYCPNASRITGHLTRAPPGRPSDYEDLGDGLEENKRMVVMEMARDVAALGRGYREDMARRGVLPMDAEISGCNGQLLESLKQIPLEFRQKAMELYSSLGL